MPGRFKNFFPSLLCLWFLFALLFSPAPTYSSTTFYKYVDEKGTVTYTNRLENVPLRYRKQALVLELDSPPATSSVVTPQSAGSPRSSPDATIPAEPASQQNSTRSSSWVTWLASLRIPLPSQLQLGVGLLTVVLVIGAIAILRYCSNPLVKIALKGFIVLILVGSAYILYFSSLNDRLSAITGKRSHSTISGQDIMTGIRDRVTEATDALQQTAVEPLMAPVQQAKDLTIGEANRTVEQANQANRELRIQLDSIDQTDQLSP